MATQTAPNPVREKLMKGLAYQKSGEIEKAQRCYKQVLKKTPNNPDALNLIGVTYRQLGFPKRAIEFIQKAIASNPNQSSFYANLARAMMDVGTDPDSLLAVSHKALSLNPVEREALNIKGIALTSLERWEEAEVTFQTVLKSFPNFGDAVQNFGLLLRKQKEHERALDLFNRAIQLMPGVAINYVERARCRLELEDLKVSRQELQDALARFPENADLQHEYARMCFKSGAVAEGLPYAERAIHENEKDPHRRVTFGVMQYSVGNFEAAIQSLDTARQLSPADMPTAEWNLSLSLMAAGRLKEAWEYHEARFRDDLSTVVCREFDVPKWDGEPARDSTVMIWNDQGVGDAIRNASLVHSVLENHEDVIFEAPVKLYPLFKRSFPDAKVRPSKFDVETKMPTIDDYDCHCCVADLGAYYRREITDFQCGRAPFLSFDKEKAQLFHTRLGAAGEKPVVGVSWRSGNLAPWRARWYLSILDFSPILETPDITFVNLQYGALEKELTWLREAKNINLHAWDDIDLRDDLDSAAALTACVDLVITANTSVGDLAGALDVPCWRFGSISTVILLGEQNPPWYPSTTYYKIQPDERAVDIVPALCVDLAAWEATANIGARKERLGL
ncbi:MAG: tetratricopeptide repeat protein [Roseibium sp.]|uniref:tetratricopeptide repeat protein n=1 Tax=Roseibium sp. TaxID=1936156 RepID=UPI0026313ECB|nr:tetratricopeptide repeat protein [Roseibium sp.]MCV0427913.1 tetratricopeptide repeat protein [Roseibium sp.]